VFDGKREYERRDFSAQDVRMAEVTGRWIATTAPLRTPGKGSPWFSERTAVKKGFFAACAAVLTGAGMTVAQPMPGPPAPGWGMMPVGPGYYPQPQARWVPPQPMPYRAMPAPPMLPPGYGPRFVEMPAGAAVGRATVTDQPMPSAPPTSAAEESAAPGFATVQPGGVPARLTSAAPQAAALPEKLPTQEAVTPTAAAETTEPCPEACCKAPKCKVYCLQPPKRVWGSAEYIMWWIRDASSSQPLVTTDASAVTPPLFTAGALGQPGTQGLFGGNPIGYGALSGVRATTGVWFNQNCTIGLEGTGFVLQRGSRNFTRTSDAAGNPVLAVPFFDPQPAINGPTVAYASYPGIFAGAVGVSTSTRLWGAEANGLLAIFRCPEFHSEAIFGFRYLNLQEDLSLNVVANGLTAPTFDAEADNFQAQNRFYGGQIGARAGFICGRFTIDFTGKVAIGTMHEVLNVSGSTIQIGAAPQGNFPGGIFSQPTNLGRQVRNELAIVPEAQVQGAVEMLWGWRALVGYTFLYSSSVVRPTDQIDRQVNASQAGGGTLLGPARPAPIFNQADFWAHGFDVGLQYRW